MKFTDEELSRILGEHEAGTLGNRVLCCCMDMAACNDDAADHGTKAALYTAWWFDGFYDFEWTTDEFLAAMEVEGFA